ncbi:MAG: histidine kinase N-terminal 7TM domain-containing protein, partial [Halobacteria archaeon]|nr:histidine kinase N-terminal 7TM domain-containing protein [Halobacteria archaeon]
MYTIPLLFIVAVSLVLTVLSYRRQPNVGSVPFAFIMMSVAIWSFGSLFHLSFTTLGMKFIGLMLVSLGALTLTFAWLLFGLEYSGNERYITTRLVTFHAVITAAIIVL